MSDEKTEKPTEKKLRDAKKKGQNAKSQDAAVGLLLLGLTVALTAGATFILERTSSAVSRTLDALGAVDAAFDLHALLVADVADWVIASVPFVGAALLLGLVGQAMQVGLQVSFEPLEPKFDKLNPASGLKKIFSMKSVIELVKTLLKAAAMTAVLWNVIHDVLPLLVGSAYALPGTIAEIGWNAALKLLRSATLVLIVIGPLDYGLQLFMFLKDQRMSKDEVKREYKEMEGDPEIKGKRKQLARELANSAPKQTVPGAAVVVTNPTHYAVALRYEAGRTPLPIVVAKGVDAEAQVIRRIAEENGVPVVSDPPLARALFRVPVFDPVPRQLFEAVAVVLRWVSLTRPLR